MELQSSRKTAILSRGFHVSVEMGRTWQFLKYKFLSNIIPQYSMKFTNARVESLPSQVGGTVRDDTHTVVNFWSSGKAEKECRILIFSPYTDSYYSMM